MDILRNNTLLNVICHFARFSDLVVLVGVFLILMLLTITFNLLVAEKRSGAC